MYDIAFYEEVRLFQLRLTGLRTTETAQAFHRHYLEVLDGYTVPFPDFPTTNDFRGLAVISPGATGSFLSGFFESAQRHIGWIAVIFQSRVAKLKAMRTAQKLSDGPSRRSRTLRYFAKASKAQRWAETLDLPTSRTSQFARS